MTQQKSFLRMGELRNPERQPPWRLDFAAFRSTTLCAVLAALTTLGCATPHATLVLIAPAQVTAGTPFSITVNVIYQDKPDGAINSHIHFASSDPKAVLPGDYYFVPADAGSHTFTNQFVLNTSGSQTVSGSIYDASGINGSATVKVSP